MNIFHNLKISHKLGFLILASLLGFAIIGAMYYYLLQRQNAVSQTILETEEAVFAAEELIIQTAQTRRQIQTFLAEANDTTLQQAQAALTGLNEHHSAFIAAAQHITEYTTEPDASAAAHDDHNETATAHDDHGETATAHDDHDETATAHDDHGNDVAATLDSINTAMTELNTAFAQLASLKAELGYDEDSGIYGTMRSAVHSLEQSLLSDRDNISNATFGNDAQSRVIDNLTLSNAMLTLRRHEKDFTLRLDDKYLDRFTDSWGVFKEQLEESEYSTDEQERMSGQIDQYFESFLQLVEKTKEINESANNFANLELSIEEQISHIVADSQTHLADDRAQFDVELSTLNQVFVGALIAVAALVIVTVLLIGGNLFGSVRRLQGAVQQVAAGDLTARANMTSNDELGQLGHAFDSMLNQRLTDLEHQAKENEQLNDSVINLMDAADRLSKRDLTVVLPVSEDITGNVSDALNQMARETARTMAEINQVAQQLEQAATVVQEQGSKVAQVAANERQVVGQALQSLEQSSDTMTEMATLAESSNKLADNTSDSTKRALVAVRKTVRSMNDIRSTVSETEKSIKRLGERSQEISAIVEIIKDIAERTHTLALNAGMQAVAAGEAGRGFSVVADEVQRLAETARESTNQISALVQSIQAESSETMATMNKTISQVVEGSELAERSGKRMRITQKTTQDLINAVEQIAERSKSLVTVNETLRTQANQLQESTLATEQELTQQAKQTRSMFQYLQNLVQSVRVFKLPKAA